MYVSGKQFNEEYGKYEFIKILRHDLTHHEYVYKPNALNELRGIFNPNANCMPGGLYFCKSKHIFTHIEIACDQHSITNLSTHPLVVIVKIPDDAKVSVGKHKFKTDKMILGQPVEIDTYITNEWILKRSSKKIKQMLDICYVMNKMDLVKKVYPLSLYKHNIKTDTWLRIMKIAVNDLEFLARILRDMNVSNMNTVDYPYDMYNIMYQFVLDIAWCGHTQAIQCCVDEGVPFNLKNNRLLRTSIARNNMPAIEYLVGVGFEIDSTDSGWEVIKAGAKNRHVYGLKTPHSSFKDDTNARTSTLLEYALMQKNLKQARTFIDMGAQLSKVSRSVIDHCSNDERFASFILANSLFSSESE